MTGPIYLDYAATTPVDNRVIAEMLKYLPLEGYFGNPASNHSFGIAARNAIEETRSIIAAQLHCEADEIIYTSGATESNNMAIKGVALALKDRGNHIITSLTEHKAVLDTCHFLEGHGFEVSYLKPDPGGLISTEVLVDAIRPSTILVSIMHVNNETGVIQDIKSLSEAVKARGILFHTDAAQGIGKLPVNLDKIPIDFMSFTAHKIYGPKGIGGLVVKRAQKKKIVPLLHGGGQESGLRPGTLPTHQIVGLGKAIEICSEEMDGDLGRAANHRALFLNNLATDGIIHFNGDQGHAIPNILNISIRNVSSALMVAQLKNEIAFSTGSACVSDSPEPSYVLQAMNIEEDWLYNPVRISFGRFTQEHEIISAAKRISQVADSLITV